MPRASSRKNPIDRKMVKDDLIHCQNSKDVIQNMYDSFVKGIATLQKRIADGEDEESLSKIRKKLGSDAWSLNNYGYDLKKYNLKALGIVPTMGKVIARGA